MQFLAYLNWHGQGLFKNVYFIVFWTISFGQTFLLYNWRLPNQNTIFEDLHIVFFSDSKSRAQELSNDLSFVIFGHQTWDLEGGVKLTPPSVSWFSSTSAGIGLKN